MREDEGDQAQAGEKTKGGTKAKKNQWKTLWTSFADSFDSIVLVFVIVVIRIRGNELRYAMLCYAMLASFSVYTLKYLLQRQGTVKGFVCWVYTHTCLFAAAVSVRRYETKITRGNITAGHNKTNRKDMLLSGRAFPPNCLPFPTPFSCHARLDHFTIVEIIPAYLLLDNTRSPPVGMHYRKEWPV